MGFHILRLLRGIGEKKERVESIEVTNQQVEDAVKEYCLRELAFWSCIGKIANALAKCEFRTFQDGKEIFQDEYYLWNYEPNRNQNKAEFISKAIEKLYRDNELLVVESPDKKQIYIADSFAVRKNTLYGNVYEGVTVDDYTFPGSFSSDEVMHWTLNNKNVNTILDGVYQSYNKLITYASGAFLKSRGSRGVLNISGTAMAAKDFEEKLKKLMDKYFKDFFKAQNAVLPLFDGYSYTDLGSKTYNETTSRDIKSQYDDIFDFTARGFGVPTSLVKGDVQDTTKAVDEMLTFCIDPLGAMLQEEINRKRYGKDMMKARTYLRVDTMKVKHTDLFDIALQSDKLISSGIYTVNMLLRVIGEPQIAEAWADQHFITKNYETIQEYIDSMNGKGGEQSNGKTD